MTHEFCTIFIRNTVKQGRTQWLTIYVRPCFTVFQMKIVQNYQNCSAASFLSLIVAELSDLKKVRFFDKIQHDHTLCFDNNQSFLAAGRFNESWLR